LIGALSAADSIHRIICPMRYPVEPFTPEEQALLAPHFTNLDRPVFALTNLPETVKGALFARYSRYPGTVRRLFLDEFAADIPEGGRPFDGEEGERAAGLYERVFMGYGDDSIAQVGGAHVAVFDPSYQLRLEYSGSSSPDSSTRKLRRPTISPTSGSDPEN